MLAAGIVLGIAPRLKPRMSAHLPVVSLLNYLPPVRRGAADKDTGIESLVRALHGASGGNLGVLLRSTAPQKYRDRESVSAMDSFARRRRVEGCESPSTRWSTE